MVFETTRLIIRRATLSSSDIAMYHRLWNHPVVMANVGFPDGLGISEKTIASQFKQRGKSIYKCCLMAIRKDDETSIGECRLSLPDSSGVSKTDVKLFPEYWNQGYGTEIKQGLVDFMFSNVPECMAVKADPAKTNIGSQRMQQHVGAVRIEPGVDYPVRNAIEYLPDDQHYLYMVFRDSWMKTKTAD